MPVDLQQARAFLAERERQRQVALDDRYARALADLRSIVDLIIRRFHPRRVYQWGSLLDRSRFSEISDLDLAVEGITDPAVLSAMLDAADRLTGLSLDLVALEKIEPEFADLIRRKGRLIYECERPDRPLAG